MKPDGVRCGLTELFVGQCYHCRGLQQVAEELNQTGFHAAKQPAWEPDMDIALAGTRCANCNRLIPADTTVWNLDGEIICIECGGD